MFIYSLISIVLLYLGLVVFPKMMIHLFGILKKERNDFAITEFLSVVIAELIVIVILYDILIRLYYSF